MANVLSAEKRQQVIALGRLGWSVRRIEEATGVRRETASADLQQAGVPVRPRRAAAKTGQSRRGVDRLGRRGGKPASAEEVSTDSEPPPGAAPPPAPASPTAS